MPFHVSTDEFERLAADALEMIPPELRARMDADNLMITIEAEPSDDDRRNGIDSHVLGFFQGSGGESTFTALTYPKRIVLLQHNIERWSRSHADLVAQVTDTVLHEVAHYFGMSHDDIDTTRLRH